MNIFANKKISVDLLNAIFVVAFVGLFVLANYFFGFSLPLFVVTMTIGALISFAHPRAGLYGIIFLTFIFERFFTLAPIVMGRNEYKLYPIDVIFGGVLVGIIFQIIIGKIKVSWKKIDSIAFAFAFLSVAYFFASVVIGKNDLSLAFSSAKNYALYSLFYFATFILIDSKEKLKELAGVVFAGAIGILWFIFYGIVVRHGLWSDFTPLSTDGIRTLAFTHGFYLSMAMIVGLIYVAHKKDSFSKWLIFLMPIWALGILGSMMRHLWISLFVAVIGIIVLFTAAQREKLKKYAISYAAFLIVFSFVAIYLATMFPRSSLYESIAGAVGMVGNRVVSIANTQGDESILWRGAVWKSAAREYSKSPIFGVGFGKKVSVEMGSYHDFVEIRNIHNSFLVLFVQMGIFGISLVGALLLILGKGVFRSKFGDETFQIAAFSSLGILVFQFVAFMFQPYLEANLLGIFFWINLGVLRSLLNMKSE